MPHKLLATRYEDFSVGGSSPVENWTDISELGIRWSVPGGIQRIELTVGATSKLDAYRRYDRHLGHTIAIYDRAMHSCIGGQIYEVVPDGRHVTYICAGPWKRVGSDHYTTAQFPATGNTDAIIKDILTDSVTIDSTDQANIGASTVAVGGWVPDIPGSSPDVAIAQLAAIGDSANNIMDFYFVDQPFSRTQMQAPLPYLKSRSTTATPDWIFSIEDLAPDGLTLARHIWDLKTHIKIGYGRLSGVADALSGATLIDAASDFITAGVQPGDRVVNITDNTVFVVDAVDDLNTLSFTNAGAGIWAVNDVFSIKLRESIYTGWPGTTTSDYWLMVHYENHTEMDQTQAEQYRDQLYATYRDAQLQQSFVISAPTIKDNIGVRYPLWRVFMGDSFYFRADNLFMDEAVFTDSDDRANSFMAVAMDYTYSDNRLRIVPSTGDSRLDAMLNQAKIINGQIVSTAAGYRAPKRRFASRIGEGSDPLPGS